MESKGPHLIFVAHVLIVPAPLGLRECFSEVTKPGDVFKRHHVQELEKMER